LQKFNEALLKAVDIAFNSLGESCKQALYFHLKTTFNIKRGEIPEKVEEFDNALKLIFKDGAVYLEKLILEKLCENLGVKIKEKDARDFVKTFLKIRNTVLEMDSLLIISDFNEGVNAKRKSEVKKFESES
jgi:hypothetical protein